MGDSPGRADCPQTLELDHIGIALALLFLLAFGKNSNKQMRFIFLHVLQRDSQGKMDGGERPKGRTEVGKGAKIR